MTQDHFEMSCRLEGIDQAGLNEAEQEYLRLLATETQPMRLNVISARLGIPPRTVQKVIEPDLVEEGFIDKTGAGERQITSKGIRHVTNSDNYESSGQVEALETTDTGEQYDQSKYST